MSGLKIYFDMDGVLADFSRGVEELCGITALDQAHRKEADDDAMWVAIKNVEHFYNRLELMPGAKELFSFAYNNYPGAVEILSGIPKPKRGILTSAEDKTEWIHRLFYDDVKVNIVYREEKKKYVLGKESILIDDLEKNINEWEENGGTGILFTSAEDAQSKLVDAVENIRVKERLDRFVKAQENMYRTAYREISNGFKESHWMWYIFPQLKGLGYSKKSDYYGIEDLAEAKAYIDHPILGKRLVEISNVLLSLQESDPEEIMGYPDNLKLLSCMTLFEKATPEINVFGKVIDKFYNGIRDEKTLKRIPK